MHNTPPDTTTSRRRFLTSVGLTASALAVNLQGQTPTGAGPLPMATLPGERPAQVGDRLTLGMVLFDGFQLLDVFGPLEMFGSVRDQVEILVIAERAGTVKSSAGPVTVVDHTFATAPKLDIVMVPGGGGTRREVNNPAFLSAVRSLSDAAPHVASICTGAAVLAKAGVLDGRRATTNKRAYAWATSQSAKVQWVPEARWVEDGKFFTSSGISAGMDMSLGLMAKLFGRERAERTANGAEYLWNSDPRLDPFAKAAGLVP